MKRILKITLIILVALFALIQFVRPDLNNPPVEASHTIFASMQVPPDVAALLRKSCFDCHSNETRWPFYSYVAPASWLVADDVKQGRRHLNFSEWGTYSARKQEAKLGKIREEVEEGGMPLPKYLLLHRDATLSQEDRKVIINWVGTVRKGGEDEGD